MAFNVKKCNVLSVTLRTKNKRTYTYKMNGEKVEGIRDTKYLGVTLNSKLTWDTHISKISSEANRMLGLLRRNLKYSPKHIKEAAYKSYVRPKTEYCATIWDPQSTKDSSKVEMVQHRAARFVSNTPHHRHAGQHASISNIISELEWETLAERRRKNRLIFLYKITNGLVDVPQTYHPQLRTTQPPRGNQQEYQRPSSEVNAFAKSFLPRTIVDWNDLNSTTAAAASLEEFRRLLC